MNLALLKAARRGMGAGSDAFLARIGAELAEIDRQLGMLGATVDATGRMIVGEVEALAGLVDGAGEKAEAHVTALFEQCVYADLMGQRLAATRASIGRLRELVGHDSGATAGGSKRDSIEQAAIDRMFA